MPAELEVKTLPVRLIVELLLPMAPPCLAELLEKDESSMMMSLPPITVMAPPMDCEFWLLWKTLEDIVTLL